jgi:hypothetical protein
MDEKKRKRCFRLYQMRLSDIEVHFKASKNWKFFYGLDAYPAINKRIELIDITELTHLIY